MNTNFKKLSISYNSLAHGYDRVCDIREVPVFTAQVWGDAIHCYLNIFPILCVWFHLKTTR